MIARILHARGHTSSHCGLTSKLTPYFSGHTDLFYTQKCLQVSVRPRDWKLLGRRGKIRAIICLDSHHTYLSYHSLQVDNPHHLLRFSAIKLYELLVEDAYVIDIFMSVVLTTVIFVQSPRNVYNNSSILLALQALQKVHHLNAFLGTPKVSTFFGQGNMSSLG